MAPHLELPDRTTERVAIERVRLRELVGQLGSRDLAESHDQPLPGEVLHDRVEAGALVTEAVRVGNAHVGERQLTGLAGAPSEHRHPPGREARGVGIDDEQRDARRGPRRDRSSPRRRRSRPTHRS